MAEFQRSHPKKKPNPKVLQSSKQEIEDDQESSFQNTLQRSVIASGEQSAGHRRNPHQSIYIPKILDAQRKIGNIASVQLIRSWQSEGQSIPKPVQRDVIQRFGGPEHAGIEQQALAGAFSEEGQQDVEFGSWANDFNQINLAGNFLRSYTPFQVTNQQLFEIARIVAEDRFGARVAQRMDPSRFGVYNPAQHFDNPATDPNAPPDVGPVARHIENSRQYIHEAIKNSIYHKQPEVGREYFGSAMHTLSDFFAHTNFIEMALRRCGVVNIQTQPGTETSPQFEQLTGGTFGNADTVVSVLHIIGGHLRRPPQPGQALTSTDRILLILLRGEHPTLAAAYERFCQLNFEARRLIPGYETMEQQMLEYRARINAHLETAANAAARYVTREATGGGVQTSHSRMNKDDVTQPHYQLARALAIYSIKQITPLMQEAWAKRHERLPGQTQSRPISERIEQLRPLELQILKLVDQFTAHPDEGSWWRQTVQPYAAELTGGRGGGTSQG